LSTRIDAPGLTALGMAGGMSFEAGAFHMLHVTFVGSVIEVYYDGLLVIRATDTAYAGGTVITPANYRHYLAGSGVQYVALSDAPSDFASQPNCILLQRVITLLVNCRPKVRSNPSRRDILVFISYLVRSGNSKWG